MPRSNWISHNGEIFVVQPTNQHNKQAYYILRLTDIGRLDDDFVAMWYLVRTRRYNKYMIDIYYVWQRIWHKQSTRIASIEICILLKE